VSHADDLPFRSRRAPVLSSRGIVATSQPLAVQAGLEMLRRGGTAADAAVAAAAALGVVEPTGTGPGGDCFALTYDAATREVSSLNGSGRAPAALSIPALEERGISGAPRGIPANNAMPQDGPHAVTVPGTVAGWADTLARHGRMPLADVLEPAIRLAEQGFPVSTLIAGYWEEQYERCREAPNIEELGIDGRAPRPGDIWRNPGLATVLHEVAEGGPDAFYRGHAARAIVEVLESLGGLMTLDDLAGHQSTFEPAVSTTYRGLRVWECPPNGQGLAALIALNVVEGFDLASLDPLSVEHLHLEIEAMRLGFADARWHVADPAFTDAPLDLLLSKGYAAERRALLDRSRATTTHRHGEPVPAGGTVYVAAVDGEGNACSFINSNYNGFGTGIVPRGTGFPLQNRGGTFSLDRQHPNALAGGKRPYHTIIPALTTYEDGPEAGALHACFAVKGGFMQPQGQLQVLVNLVDHGMDPQAALDQPRFCLRPALPSGRLYLEAGISVDVMHRLTTMGHDVVPSTDRFVFGTGQAVVRQAGSGAFWGGTDPRADGAVAAMW
jgi:gamma-glutamyltranspeptidase/glutathione hydrolase